MQETFIDELLADQQNLLQTPVANFSDKHDQGTLPDQATYYKKLIPLSAPRADEQYAFEVNLDQCTGCKACVTACHSLNGLDNDEAWRDTGLLLGEFEKIPYQQTVTTACHHCADPGCLNGCPVMAYEKDEKTGIVRHLDDQCIGCQYCILKCPYDVPKYSKKRGIVRKCDMCYDRLGDGEAPACVQACPNEAIKIVTVPKQASVAFLNAAPDPEITQPTTRYLTKRSEVASALAADKDAIHVEEMHWPLSVMLVITQCAVGLLAFSQALLFSSILLVVGLGLGTLHLGRPMGAWKAFLGLRTSWLSREIIAFGGLAGISFAYAAFDFFALPGTGFLRIATILFGLGSVFTSVMIYVDTHRPTWEFPTTATKFYGTVLWAGLLFVNPLAAATIGIAKLTTELLFLRNDRRSTRALLGPLRLQLATRMIVGVLAIIVAFISPWIAFVFVLISEIFERLLYFQAVEAFKMPGGIVSHESK